MVQTQNIVEADHKAVKLVLIYTHSTNCLMCCCYYTRIAWSEAQKDPRKHQRWLLFRVKWSPFCVQVWFVWTRWQLSHHIPMRILTWEVLVSTRLIFHWGFLDNKINFSIDQQIIFRWEEAMQTIAALCLLILDTTPSTLEPLLIPQKVNGFVKAW